MKGEAIIVSISRDAEAIASLNNCSASFSEAGFIFQFSIIIFRIYLLYQTHMTSISNNFRSYIGHVLYTIKLSQSGQFYFFIFYSTVELFEPSLSHTSYVLPYENRA